MEKGHTIGMILGIVLLIVVPIIWAIAKAVT